MTPETPSPSVTTVGERRDAIVSAFEKLIAFGEEIEREKLVGDEGCLWPVEEARVAMTDLRAILSLESPAQVTGEGMTSVAEREAVNRLKAVASSFPDHNDRDGIGWTRVRWDDLNAVLASTPTANAPVGEPL